MSKTILMIAASAMILSTAAAAQTMPPMSGSARTEPPQQASQATSQDSEDAASFARPGMLVKDAQGAGIGSVVKVGKSSVTGESVVVVSVDGKTLNLAATSLKPAGSSLISTMTKAQILAAARAPG